MLTPIGIKQFDKYIESIETTVKEQNYVTRFKSLLP